ncbi:MAG: patatin-like phospholipase family protein [Acidimicrobiales bacterium]
MADADFESLFAATTPTRVEPAPRSARAGLALSGGGYRAMIFHCGALRRLYEVGALARIDRISSVSGGSIAAAHLALNWDDLMAAGTDTRTYTRLIEEPLLKFASTNLDVPAGVKGLLLPGRSIAQSVGETYERWFEGATLQDLPDAPRFVFCATNLGTGSLVRFAKPYTADRRVGKRDRLDLKLSQVIAASAAFPPVLSPMTIELGDSQALTQQFDGDPRPELADTEYARRLQLSDGGVYDNLGLQPVEGHQTVLVSDGGGPFQYESDVATNWLQHMIRTWKVTDNQVRSLRRSELIDDFENKRRNGAFWGISTLHSAYQAGSIPVDDSWTDRLRAIPTRLAPIGGTTARQLVNFSYCLTDAALARYVLDGATVTPAVLPHPDHPISGPAPAGKKKPFWKFWG